MEKTDHSIESASARLSTKEIQSKQEDAFTLAIVAAVEKHVRSATVQAAFVHSDLDESEQRQVLHAGLKELLRRAGSETFAERAGTVAYFSEESVLQIINHSGLIGAFVRQKAV